MQKYSEFPTFGKILNLIIKSFGINDNINNTTIGRFEKEEEISVTEYNKILDKRIKSLLSTFFENPSSVGYEPTKHIIKNLTQVYNEFILSMETRKLSQKHLNYLLLKDFGIPIFCFISALLDFKNNIELNGNWAKTNPLEKLLHWIDNSLDTSLVDELIYTASEDGQEITSMQQNLDNWINDIYLPNIDNINNLSKLAKPLHIKNQELKNIILLTRLYQSVFKKIATCYGENLAYKLKEHFDLLKNIFTINFNSNNTNEFKKNMKNTLFPLLEENDFFYYVDRYVFPIRKIFMSIQCPTDNFTIEKKKELSKLFEMKDLDYSIEHNDFFENIEIFLPTNRLNNKLNETQKQFNSIQYHKLNNQFGKKISSPDYYVKTLTRLFELTFITNQKNDNSEKIYNDLLNSLSEKFEIKNDPYICFMQARYFAQKKEYKKSTSYYLEALKYGKHKLGESLKSIIKEGLIVSAKATKGNYLDLINAKSPFTKFYIEAYLYGLIAGQPEEISQYFVNDIKKAFDSYFKCFFPNIQENKIPNNSNIVSIDKLKKIRLDYKQPNKLIRTIYPNPVSQLMHCIIIKNEKAILKLIAKGVDINHLKPSDGGTALIMALQGKLTKIAKILIPIMSKEALDAKTVKHKRTAFSLAIENGYVGIVKLLIKYGADVNIKGSKDELTPLYMTLNYISLAKKANGWETKCNESNPYDSSENRIKMSSYFNGVIDEDKEAKLKLLLNKRPLDMINEFMKDNSKKFIGIEPNMLEIVNILLEVNPDLEIEHNGHTVLTLATEYNDFNLVKKLLSAGANINHEVRPGIKAYHYAKLNNNKELCDLLDI